MSKQSEAKQKQGYEPDPIIRVCSTCIHYRNKYAPDKYGDAEEVDSHCDIGGFTVKKMGTCNLYWRNKNV